MSRPLTVLRLSRTLLFLAAPLHAAESTPALTKPDPIDHGTFSFYFENDLSAGLSLNYQDIKLTYA